MDSEQSHEGQTKYESQPEEYGFEYFLAIYKDKVIFPLFEREAINDYIELLLVRAFLCLPKAILLPYEHSRYSHNELDEIAKRMQNDIYRRYNERIEYYFLNQEGNGLLDSDKWFNPKNIVRFIPAGFDYPSISNAIHSQQAYSISENRGSTAETITSLQKAQVHQNITDYATESGYDPQAVINNLTQLSQRAHSLPFSSIEDIKKNIVELLQQNLESNPDRKIFIKLDQSASGGGVIEFSCRDLSNDFDSCINSLLDFIAHYSHSQREEIESNFQYTGVVMESFGDIESSVTFVKIDQPPYFKLLFLTDNITDKNNKHIGNIIYSPEEYKKRKFLPEEYIDYVQKTLSTFLYLWCTQHGISIDSLKAGEIFGLDLRHSRDNMFELFPIDNNSGRFNGPTYTVLQYLKNTGYTSLQHVIDQQYHEADTDHTSNLNLISPTFTIKDKDYYSTINSI
jgi:hypothetical protein